MRMLFIPAIVVLALATGQEPLPVHCIGALHAQAAMSVQRSGQRATTPAMPPPSNPDHVKPAEGAFCSFDKNPAHTCSCHKKCDLDKDGNPQYDAKGNPATIEDRQCRAWCYKSHCKCPLRGCP